MAKMIPSMLSPDMKSNAEKRIFQLLQTNPITKDWVVFHSFGLENHINQVRGEIDFLVLIPNIGIFILEVKGGRVKRENGMWIFTDRFNVDYKKIKGPSDQAKDSMYTLVEELNKLNFSYLKKLVLNFCVVFPDIEYTHSDFDIDEKQILDKRKLSNLKDFFITLKDYTISKHKNTGLHQISPDHIHIEELKTILRPNFDYIIPLNVKIETQEKLISGLTKLQYNILDSIELNPRVLINGYAGTGKTLLAIELAKVINQNEQSIAFFTYNTLLAESITQHLKRYNLGDIFVSSFTEFMNSFIKPDYTINNMDKYYTIDLPLNIIYYSKTNALPKFDILIVDEAQDIISKEYLNVLDLLLNQGLKDGKWYFFGDFHKQLKFNFKENTTHEKILSLLNEFSSFSQFFLKQNCRNSLPIIQLLNRFFDTPINTMLSESQYAANVEFISYTNLENELFLLDETLDLLLRSSIKKSDITILSFLKYDDSIVKKSKHIIQEYRYNSSEISYSTIRKFKGLENKVIIITDIKHILDENLVYTAISRAKDLLYLFIQKDQFYKIKKEFSK